MKNIKHFLIAALFLIGLMQPTFAALTASTIFEFESGATANLVNGAGFNPANANFLTNLAATSANTSAPVITSASYNFNVGNAGAGGDVGAWVYISSGTHWTPTQWCKIASVASNAATLDAAIGHCITSINQQGTVTTNTTVGITSDNTATLSSGTGGIDYTQQSTGQIAAVTTGTQTAASTTFSDATASPFTVAMAGNLIHITACTGTGCLTGWYEIVSVTSASAVVLDRTATNGANNITAATYYVGGAGNFGALEDTFQSILPASSIVYLANGTYTFSGALSTANANCTGTATCFWIGYNTLRGDAPTGSSRPTLVGGANAITFGGTLTTGRNLIFTTTAAGGIVLPQVVNTKVTNTSTTTTRVAFGGTSATDSEFISLNGTAFKSNPSISGSGNYIHDSTNCMAGGSTNTVLAIGNIFEACDTAAITTAGGGIFQNNTIYGKEAKIGVGVSLGSTAGNRVYNNIFYGLTTGISGSAAEYSNIGRYNDYFNNTTDVTNFLKGSINLALDPTFTNETNITPSGTVIGNTTTLTDSTANFSVTDNIDVLHVTSIAGSGCTVGKYLITGHTTTTLTLNNSLGGAACTSVVYFIPHGHNFQIGTNLKGLGAPAFTNNTAGATTSYMDIGSVQRQEPAGGGTVGYAAP